MYIHKGGKEMKKIKKTLYLDKDVVQAIKFVAVEKGKTESEVVNEALEEKKQMLLQILYKNIPQQLKEISEE